MSEDPCAGRCSNCVWSGFPDIPSAFVVVDCGRHGEGEIGKTLTEKLRAKMREWSDRLTITANVKLSIPRDPCPKCYGEGSWDTERGGGWATCDACKGTGKVPRPDYNPSDDHETDVDTYWTTREVRAISALLDEAAERLRAYEDDLALVRAELTEQGKELARLQRLVRR